MIRPRRPVAYGPPAHPLPLRTAPTSHRPHPTGTHPTRIRFIHVSVTRRTAPHRRASSTAADKERPEGREQRRVAPCDTVACRAVCKTGSRPPHRRPRLDPPGWSSNRSTVEPARSRRARLDPPRPPHPSCLSLARIHRTGSMKLASRKPASNPPTEAPRTTDSRAAVQGQGTTPHRTPPFGFTTIGPRTDI